MEIDVEAQVEEWIQNPITIIKKTVLPLPNVTLWLREKNEEALPEQIPFRIVLVMIEPPTNRRSHVSVHDPVIGPLDFCWEWALDVLFGDDFTQMIAMVGRRKCWDEGDRLQNCVEVVVLVPIQPS